MQSRERARHRQGPQQRRRAADRRHGLRCEPPSTARRRDRNGEDRARRRLRPARHRGGLLKHRRRSRADDGDRLFSLVLPDVRRFHNRERRFDRDRNLHHRDRDRRRQDVRRRLADSAFARTWAVRSTPSSRSSSGYDPAQAATSDPGVLLAALGLPFTPESIDRISPWRFRAALSPDLAARAGGPQHRRRSGRGLLPERGRAATRHSADRRRRRHHGAARRRSAPSST